MMKEFEINDLSQLSNFIYTKSVNAVKKEIKKIPNGVYKNSMKERWF